MKRDICPHTGKEYDCARCEGAKEQSFEGGKSVHMGHSVTGPLMNWNKKQWKQGCEYMTPKNGGKYTPEELKAEFVEMASHGWKTIPFGDCDNFCYKNGCMGHPEKEES